MNFIYNEISYNTKAAKEVVPIIMELLKPKSIIDVGCGIGTWLSVFEDFGVKDIVGIDGEYVDRNLLHISEDKFIPKDLTKPLKLDRKFDLVVCLEVAEHLPEAVADTFIEGLVSLGDFILFSAAIPGQGGEGHLNEQWPTYWQSKFKQHGFDLCDFIRSGIWLNESIDWWYRQNIFLVVKEDTKVVLPGIRNPLDIVHPELYKSKVNQLDYLDNRLRNIINQLEYLDLDLWWLEMGRVPVKIAFNILIKAVRDKIIYLINK